MRPLILSCVDEELEGEKRGKGKEEERKEGQLELILFSSRSLISRGPSDPEYRVQSTIRLYIYGVTTHLGELPSCEEKEGRDEREGRR